MDTPLQIDPRMPGERHLLVWDGSCAFCRASVRLIRRLDRAGRFCDVPWQQAPSPPMTPALREASSRRIQVITAEGRVHDAGRASLFILAELGWRRTARVLGRRPLIWLVELGYHLVSVVRHAISKLVPMRPRTELPLPRDPVHCDA